MDPGGISYIFIGREKYEKYIVYAKKDEETLIQNQIYVHELGTDQSEDKLIYREDDNEFNIWLSESRTKKYIYIYCKILIT